MKHGGGSLIIWGLLQHVVMTDVFMNFANYQYAEALNLVASAKRFTLGCKVFDKRRSQTYFQINIELEIHMYKPKTIKNFNMWNQNPSNEKKNNEKYTFSNFIKFYALFYTPPYSSGLSTETPLCINRCKIVSHQQDKLP